MPKKQKRDSQIAFSPCGSARLVLRQAASHPSALPFRLDGEVQNLGKYAACRRVARTIYLGSAPTATAAHRGIEDRRIRLGCVMPGEAPAVFGDALRRLATAATYLYQDGARYWYSTQPTVTKIAEDRAEQLTREPDKVAHEIEKRIRAEVRHSGDFRRVHPLPLSSQDVPDETEARLVVLSIDHPYTKDPSSAALVEAKSILEMRGNAPRLFRNALVFLAVDQSRLQDLDEAARRFLAWDSGSRNPEIGNQYCCSGRKRLHLANASRCREAPGRIQVSEWKRKNPPLAKSASSGAARLRVGTASEGRAPAHQKQEEVPLNDSRDKRSHSAYRELRWPVPG